MTLCLCCLWYVPFPKFIPRAFPKMGLTRPRVGYDLLCILHLCMWFLFPFFFLCHGEGSWKWGHMWWGQPSCTHHSSGQTDFGFVGNNYKHSVVSSSLFCLWKYIVLVTHKSSSEFIDILFLLTCYDTFPLSNTMNSSFDLFLLVLCLEWLIKFWPS